MCGGKLRVVGRPFGQLPAQDRRTVAPGGDRRLVGAEGCPARVEAGELAGGDVDHPAARGQRELLVRGEQILVEGE